MGNPDSTEYTLGMSDSNTMDIQSGPSQEEQDDDDDLDCVRSRSMSEEVEKERRASIKAILADATIPEVERRRSIQYLMDGRNSVGGGSSRNSLSDFSSCEGSINSINSTQQATSMEADSGAGFAQLNHPPTILTPIPTAIPSLATFEETCCAVAVSTEQSRRAELTRQSCSHYERNCTLIAPCCGAAFGCRICHDDCPVLPPKMDVSRRKYPRSSSLPSSFTTMDTTPEETHHNIDRFAVKEVICRECYTRQSSKTNNCINCGVQFGKYHCSTCNLWMSDAERPYHCEYCGFCRVGGAENFLHCHDCGMCIDKKLYNKHNCKVDKYKSNCPVCQEYLFSSRSASHEMPCGHAIHWDCFRQLAAHDSRCPVCKKTAETKERMMPTWNAMAAGVTMQLVPPELARVVNITCNDCERSDDARAWHFLGVQCRNCSSFNTVVDRIVLSGEEAHQFLQAIELRSTSSEPTQRQSCRYQRRQSNLY